MTLVVAGLVVAFILVSLLIRATQGPSTKDEVCASFDSMSEKLRDANGLFDNAIFNEAEDLAELAGRFDGPPDLTQDGDALGRIGDSNVTNAFELASATRHIAILCGHSLLA